MTEDITPMDFFPYQSPRKGQTEMMQDIYLAIKNRKQICAEAPNGFGKTCVALCGVLPWVQENGGKILYCARTHRQLDRVIEELRAINSEEDVVSGLSFRGRRHMCLNPFVLENAGVVASISEICSELKSGRRCAYYEPLRRERNPIQLLKSMPRQVLTAPEIVDIAKKKQICPYEMAKILAQVVDVVALSYLYVFSPWVMEAFLPDLETPLSKIILIQDEAHNVPSTALDSASDSLPLSSVKQGMREAAKYNDSISNNFCRGLAQCIVDSSKNLENNERLVDSEGVYQAALILSGLDEQSNPLEHMVELGAKIRRGLIKDSRFPVSYIYRVGEFMSKWRATREKPDYTFLLSSSKGYSGSRRVALDLVALDPTVITTPILEQVYSSVAISGTISPLSAYAEMLGFEKSAELVAYQSPFASENRLGIIIQDIDTAYNGRGSEMYNRIIEHCVSVVNATPGNTGIFTTSYYIAKSLLKAGLERHLKKPFFIEKQGMKGRENDDLIEGYKKESNNGGAVLLGVQGGRNSEGGDFPGSTMNSVIVVGVPYARPTPRTESLIKYFDNRFQGKGRDYAYVLPAMTRATQAAGRPVRRLSDRGAIVMLDQRFATPYLERFLPKWLKDVIEVLPDDPSKIGERIGNFFNN
jgi:DNA excision repair protein ERCC-2